MRKGTQNLLSYLPGGCEKYIRKKILYDWGLLARGVNYFRVKGALQSARPIKLEIGSCRRPGREDWVFAALCGEGLDFRLDAREKFPFPDNCLRRIYSSHLIEHLSARQIRFFLGECRRVLKPGGIFSAAVPDASIYINAYLSGKGADFKKLCPYDKAAEHLSAKAKIDLLNFIAYSGGEHHHMFDKEGLVLYLSEAGFEKVRIRDFDCELDEDRRRWQSIYIEARK